MKAVTFEELFDIHSERLSLEWVAGRTGGKRRIVSDDIHNTDASSVRQHDVISIGRQTQTPDAQDGGKGSPKTSLVGYLNLIHPNHIQILGNTEVNYLRELRKISRQDAIRQILSHQPDAIIVAEEQSIPEGLAIACEGACVPLIVSKVSSTKLVEDLYYYLSSTLAKSITLHGVYMEVITIGVLLTGDSGVGKSELALELITRGHRLVADDAPEFSLVAPDTIKGSCPEILRDFLEVRGLGLINVRELFGAGAIKRDKFMRLILRLERLEDGRLLRLDRLEGSYRMRKVLGLDVPEITLPVAPGRNLAVLVECAAKNHILRLDGYIASEDFMEKQRCWVEKESSS